VARRQAHGVRQVTAGLDVVDKLEGVQTDGTDRPKEPIGIASIELSD